MAALHRNRNMDRIVIFVTLLWCMFTTVIVAGGDSVDIFCPLISDAPSLQRTINVHLVPHTHDDVGWLKTVDQYYYGLNSTIQNAHVEKILDSVLSALSDTNTTQKRTFTYVETKFFSKWYTSLSVIRRQLLKHLIAKKQWSFANGGWCMHDEANAHYMGMIDQTTLGHTFLKKELDVIPKVGWQLDPFGHSSTQGSLLTSGVGFDALYFGRIHYVDLENRKEKAEAEGIWSSTYNSSVFWGLTGSYSGNYGGPSGFCFDVKCQEWGEEDQTLDNLTDAVLLQRIQNFTKLLAIQANQTKGRNIMLTMGMDFFYAQADMNFRNMDILIEATNRFINNGSIKVSDIFGNRFDKLNIFYSNPERYTKCKYADSKQEGSMNDNKASMYDPSTWKTKPKTGDFFPYADCDHCYWAGYFSSRQGLKRLERVGSSFLHSARQIESMMTLYTGRKQTNDDSESSWTSSPLYSLDDAMGIAQHHDAVTGTSKQHVAYDYAKRIAKGMNDSGSYVTDALRKLLLGIDTDLLENLSHCHLLNETICDISQAASKEEDTAIYVVVYNAIARIRTEAIPLPVNMANRYLVEQLQTDMVWSEVSSSLIPNQNYAQIDGAAQLTLYFNASDIPPLGASIFRITNTKLPPVQPVDDLTVSNGVLSVGFDSSTGAIKFIAEQREGGTSVNLVQEYGYYTAFARDEDSPPITDNKFASDDGWSSGYKRPQQNGGAYIFRPATADQFQVITPKADASTTVVYKTDLVTEVHAEFGDYKQIIRLIDGKDYVEVEYVVGPIPIEDGIGKEIVSRYTTTIQNNGIFYTDANGREFMKRKRNDSKVFGYDADFDPFIEPIAGNYYPVNTAIFIEDESQSFTILTDRSQAGSSISDGSIELLIQRRLLADDARGVGEPLNETMSITACPPYGNATRIGDGIIIKGTHRLMIGGKRSGAARARSHMDESFSRPQVFVASASKDVQIPFHQPGLSLLKTSLPDNVMIVTYAALDDDSSSFLIRLAHQYGMDESNVYSTPVHVNLQDLFPNYDIIKVTEKTLSANQDRVDWEKRRLNWNESEEMTSSSDDKSMLDIVLKPMEIRTFVINIKMSGVIPSSSCSTSSSWRLGAAILFVLTFAVV